MPTLYQLAQVTFALFGCYWLYELGYWRGQQRGLRVRAGSAWDAGWNAGLESGIRRCVSLLAWEHDPKLRAAALSLQRYFHLKPRPSTAGDNECTRSHLTNAPDAHTSKPKHFA